MKRRRKRRGSAAQRGKSEGGEKCGRREKRREREIYFILPKALAKGSTKPIDPPHPTSTLALSYPNFNALSAALNTSPSGTHTHGFNVS